MAGSTRMRLFVALAALTLGGSRGAGGETVRLEATADIWVSSFPGEEGFSAGRHPLLKLKSIQELAVIRFDAAPAVGREVLRARLLLRRAGKDKLRYLRVSTVNGDWEEGTRRERLGKGDGAAYDHAALRQAQGVVSPPNHDGPARRPWAWTGSQLCDVIMSSGNSLACWAEHRELADGWLSVDLAPELVTALAVGDSDGLAVMDGGTPSFENNFVHSVQSRGSAPYIEAELGARLDAVPARPGVQARPAPGRAHLASGAIEVTIAPDPRAFCWRLKRDGSLLPRWRVGHPAAGQPTVVCLDDLGPSAHCELEVMGVSAGGKVSEPAGLAVTASPSLPQPPVLRPRPAPAGGAEPPCIRGKMRVLAYPSLVKIGPERGEVMFNDAGPLPLAEGKESRIRLFGARGETVSFQLAIENLAAEPLKGVAIAPEFAVGEVELFRLWLARNKDGRWQPAYCVPLRAGAPLEVPDPARGLAGQRFQAVHVDVTIPKDAKAGTHAGSLKVAVGPDAVTLPVSVEVLDFALPDTLCFWPQLNAYEAPKGILEYYRLAHQHRCVLFYRYWRPEVEGAGRNARVLWDRYDQAVGPLLSGEAFRGCRRAGVPIEALALPFADSWPTPLTPQTYRYTGHWPKRGDPVEGIVQHYLTAPYIGDALSQDYKDAFAAVQRQFIEHFREKGWRGTEMQCLFVGKNTHRIQYGANMWWTTDEPYHWDDWLALRYFGRLWASGRRLPSLSGRGQGEGGGPNQASPSPFPLPGRERGQWVARADISRPEWQGRVLDGAGDTVYFGTGALRSQAGIRRCETLAREAPLDLRVYGSASADNASNLGTVAWVLHAFLHGANAALPWQALGNEKALDANDQAVGGNALLAPGERFAVPVVADLRLKALRDAEQLAEYLRLAAERCHLNAEQLRAMVRGLVEVEALPVPGAGADNADALAFSRLDAGQLAELRRALAEVILAAPQPPAP